MMSGVYLSIGGNQGHRTRMLERARLEIVSRIGHIKKASSLYETKAWGEEKQPDFLNQVLKIETELKPEQCMRTILEIENDLGRKRTKKWGPRTIDIDIIYFGYEVVDSHKLRIPHPHLQERKFVLLPLNEIAPGFIHPILRKRTSTLLQKCSDTLAVEIYKGK